MTADRQTNPSALRAGQQLPGLTVCESCAGDTLPADKQPGGQAARLAALERSGVARLRFVDCLDVCDRDVLVARPSPAGRAGGGRPVWFARLAGDGPTAQLRGWLKVGGPGRAPVPETLRRFVIGRPN